MTDPPLPGDKLDLVVAVPDFAFGAMENPAARLERVLLLVDPTAAPARSSGHWTSSPTNAPHAGSATRDHGWWNGIWLNEAFCHLHGDAHHRRLPPEWERLVDSARRAPPPLTSTAGATRPIGDLRWCRRGLRGHKKAT